ncbi:MAG TPA: glycosyltransferase family 39 protein [Pirellulales bacterium]|nr:glycosyltransferase family 39 protein [Pirellulales bacterium]
MNENSRWRTFGLASAISCSCALVLLATAASLPLAWDEGDTIFRAEAVTQLVEQSGQEGEAPFFTSVREQDNWPFTTVREGHPPVPALVIAIGTWLAPPGLDPLVRARFGPILLFSLAVGAMFYRLQRDYRAWQVSVMAVAALMTMPRLFAHAHFATLDGPLTACWVLAWAAFGPACRDWRMIPLFALTLGLVLTAKFTGWLAVLPFAVWTYMYRDRGGMRALAVAVPLAIGLFVLLNPPLWDHPIGGLERFFELSLHRSDNPRFNISTQFFGKLYNLDHPLPWYNTLVWTVITIPPVPLVLGILGIVATVRCWQTDRASALLVCQWATLIVVRALPFAPPHDAERLILPSFAFFAALIGVGLGRGLYRATLLQSDRIVAQGWAKVAMTLALVFPTLDSISYFPHGLSYYNRLIGGLRGATALGMESTYYWDSLDRDALAWLREHTAGNQRVIFSTAPPKNLELLRRWGQLPRSSRSAPPTWYVLQRRPSAWHDWDRQLIEHEQPAYQSTFGGVPLLDIYSYEAFVRVRTMQR